MNPKNYLSSAEQRARAILDAYGSLADAWPANERQTTLDCIARSPFLQDYRAQLAELDLRIAAAQYDAVIATPSINTLQQRILFSLPIQSHLSANKKHLNRRSAIFNWPLSTRFAMTLASLLLLAILLDQYRPSHIPQTHLPASASLAAWTWYDVTGQNLPSRQASSTLTITDLIDTGLNQNGG